MVSILWQHLITQATRSGTVLTVPLGIGASILGLFKSYRWLNREEDKFSLLPI